MPYPYSSAIGSFSIGQSPIGATVPAPTASPLTTTIPSYLYGEYFDDDDLQSFIDAYNTLQQAYLAWFNALNLPVYPQLASLMLDWVGSGLYGLDRPVIVESKSTTVGAYATTVLGEFPAFAELLTTVDTQSVLDASDDVYQRAITWHFYKGDGRTFSTRWLKRRIQRFLAGGSGWSPPLGDTRYVSVGYGPDYNISITLVTFASTICGGAIYGECTFGTDTFAVVQAVKTVLKPEESLAATFQQLVQQGVLEMPFQYSVVINPSGPLPMPYTGGLTGTLPSRVTVLTDGGDVLIDSSGNILTSC